MSAKRLTAYSKHFDLGWELGGSLPMFFFLKPVTRLHSNCSLSQGTNGAAEGQINIKETRADLLHYKIWDSLAE